METPAAADVVLHLLVVGFHHTKGNCIEFVYPTGVDLEHPPPGWDAIPFIALPDGVHAFDHDYVLFTTPPLPEDAAKHGLVGSTLYGVSCYRQVKADATLKAADATVTRSSIQKAVVALSRYPLFGAIQHRLAAATQSYFAQSDFANKDILRGIQASLNQSLTVNQIRREFLSYVHMGLDVRSLLLRFGRNTLVLLKLVLLGRKIVMHSLPVRTGCVTVLSLASLIPGALSHLDPDLLRVVDLEVPVPNHCAAPSGEEPDWGRLGFPLMVWSNAELVRQQWAHLVDRRTHQTTLLLPFAALNQLDEMHAANGFLACTSNQLFLNLRPEQAHVVANVGDGTVQFRLPGLERLVALTNADRRFIDHVLLTVRESEDESRYAGSDGWVREQFRAYLGGLVATAAKVPMAFDTHFAERLRTTPEADEYGKDFVVEWIMHSASFARWVSRADHLYVSMPAQPLLTHPSGPPTDAIDEHLEALATSLADAKERAKKKFSSFFSEQPKPAEAPTTRALEEAAPPPAAPIAAASPPSASSSLDDLRAKAAVWWRSTFAPPPVDEVVEDVAEEEERPKKQGPE